MSASQIVEVSVLIQGGQSSLTLALLRCIPTEGKVYFDGLPTDSVNLGALRSNITIIPQVVRSLPVVLSTRALRSLLARAVDWHASRESGPVLTI